jgi:hypothetical protein
MTYVAVEKSVADVIDALGMDFVDCVKNAKNIAMIVSGNSVQSAQMLMNAITTHSRTPVTIIGAPPWHETAEGSIPRGDDVRMPIIRPKVLIDTDVVMMIGQRIHDVRRKTEGLIEQYLFATWHAPQRNDSRFFRSHDPWLEGDLHDVVIADLYTQKPITLALYDGSTSDGNLLGGFDAIAVESIAARMRGIDPGSLPYLSALADRGFGTCTMSNINVPIGIITSDPFRPTP